MTVEEKIKSIVGEMDINYLFENWQNANVRLDSEKLPACINILPVSGVFNLRRNQIKDFPNCMLAFVDQTEFDFKGPDNDKIIERCKAKAKEFIFRLNQSGLFEEVEGDIGYSILYDKLDVNVTGVVLSLTIKEIKGIVVCGKDLSNVFN